ncbi:MAG TPA: hypothetical protein PLT75_06775 [Spirochaetota bacterium]|nr:hypothetical protein [Spirochaetota bacterium]
MAKKYLLLTVIILFGAWPNVRGAVTAVAVGGSMYRFHDSSILHYSGSYSGIVQRGKLAENNTVTIGQNTVVFAKDTDLEFYIPGKIALGYLSADTLCRAGSRKFLFRKGSRIDFYESGNVSKGYLARDCTMMVGGKRFRFKKGTEEIEDIELYKTGGIKSAPLSGTCTVRIGGNSMTLHHIIGFYKNGSIGWGFLNAESPVIAGGRTIRCTGGPYHQITFHNNGNVRECVLAGPQRLMAGGREIIFESRIMFSPDGKIIRGTLGEGTGFQGRNYTRYTTVILGYNSRGQLTDMKRFRHPRR